MLLEQREKELAAIGASIGANCRPCIEHHIRAGRDAGLSAAALAAAVEAAAAVREQAVEQLSVHVDELLGRPGAVPPPSLGGATSRDLELVALGASVGANAHALLRAHIVGALEAGLAPTQVEAAVKMAEHVQRRAGEITAGKATDALAEVRSPVAVGSSR